MKNFMTHKFTELTPSARINLIMGSNGSGKSSIVCAICLGLGGDPSSMQRSNELKGFIMKGADEAYVQIVLSGGPGKPDITVKRILTKDRFDPHRDAASRFFINDMIKPVTSIVFDKLMLDLNIQMDNQTQFLPQEKIGAFTENSPQRLLGHTMRAISTELTAEHEDLVKESKTVGTSALTIEALQREIAEIDGKIAKLAGALGNYEASERLDTQAKILNIQLLAAERDELFAQAEVIRVESVVSVEEYAKLGAEIPRVAAELTKAAEAKKEIEVEKKESDAEMKRASVALLQLHVTLEEDDDKIKVKIGEITSAEKAGKQMEVVLGKLETTLAASAKAYEAATKAMGTVDAKGVLAAKEEYTKLGAAVEKTEEDIEKSKGQVGDAERSLVKAERYLAEVEGVPARRRDAMFALKRTLAPASLLVKTAREKGELKGAVLGPLLLDIEVIDVRFAAQVELALNSDWARGFLVLNPDDERAMGAMDLQTSYSTFKETDAKEFLAKIPSRAEVEAMRVALGLTDLFCAPELARVPDTILGYLISKSLVHNKFISSDPNGVEKCLRNKAVIDKKEVICVDATVSCMGTYLQRSSVPKPKVLHIMLDSVKAAEARATVTSKKAAFDSASAGLTLLTKQLAELVQRHTNAKRVATSASSAAKLVETTKGTMASNEKRLKAHRETMASAASGKAFFAQTIHEVRGMQAALLRAATGLAGAAKDHRNAAETSAASALQLAFLKVKHQLLSIEHTKLKTKLNSADKNRAEIEKQILDLTKNANKLVSHMPTVPVYLGGA